MTLVLSNNMEIGFSRFFIIFRAGQNIRDIAQEWLFAKKIVEYHGGGIYAQSIANNRATLVLVLHEASN